MSTQADFPSKLASIKLAMEHEEWGNAMQALENIGTVPDKFHAVVSNILFFIYVSRNQYNKLAPLSERFDPAKSKDCVAALLLYRAKELDYPLELPKSWKPDTWEQAIETHALAGKLESMELQLSLFFLSFLNRPRLLDLLHSLVVESGGLLDSESVEVVLRCYLRNKWYQQARRFIWINNLNNIAFERFNFLVDRAEKSATAIPESNDKFLTFLRYKFGSDFPASTT